MKCGTRRRRSCRVVTLPDGTQARVYGAFGELSAETLAALQEAANAVRAIPRCPACKRPNTITEGHCEICGWKAEDGA